MKMLLSSYVILLSAIFWVIPASANEQLNDALVYHAYFGKADAVIRTLKKGADANAKDEHGWPVIAVAADRSDGQAFAISYALIKAGANINIAKDGNYAIFNAIKHNNTKLVALLVSESANLNVTNQDGLTVMAAARKTGNKRIIEILDKRIFEEQQLLTFLSSTEHLKQITSEYGFHHCAFQYWGYYLRSKQDKGMNEDAIKGRMQHHANEAARVGRLALQYFPDIYNQHYDVIASKQREHISKTLNELISNRNRRVMGVGKIEDMFKRCNLKKTPLYFHAVAAPYSQ